MIDIHDRLAKRVALGAAALDVASPDWAHRVDADALEMNSCSMCVVGQLAGSIDDFRRVFPGWIDFRFIPTQGHPLTSHGFWLCGDDNTHQGYTILTRLWKDAIYERRTPQCATCGEHSPRGPFRGMVHRFGPRDHPFIPKAEV